MAMNYLPGKGYGSSFLRQHDNAMPEFECIPLRSIDMREQGKDELGASVEFGKLEQKRKRQGIDFQRRKGLFDMTR